MSHCLWHCEVVPMVDLAIIMGRHGVFRGFSGSCHGHYANPGSFVGVREIVTGWVTITRSYEAGTYSDICRYSTIEPT